MNYQVIKNYANVDRITRIVLEPTYTSKEAADMAANTLRAEMDARYQFHGNFFTVEAI